MLDEVTLLFGKISWRHFLQKEVTGVEKMLHLCGHLFHGRPPCHKCEAVYLRCLRDKTETAAVKSKLDLSR